ncbi:MULTISPECIES: NAD(P)-binding protein [Rhodomicrobium]|uniref:NAD(P)-binding protein n=1 Tax=Rhodomicrobium TaxID=1068 RepID=UPI000B4A7108|nr:MULTISPECIES: NAD(P)-binding protein [Rhodomicrobium]
MKEDLPVAVIGAGPVGLAAAAQLVARALTPLIFERGPRPAATIRDWAHVRLFSPWRYNVDEAARALLTGTGWTAPDPDRLPTGGELAGLYLDPLAAHPAIAPHLHFDARVTAIGRLGIDKLQDAGRADTPFVISWTDAEGMSHRSLARAVIDASGTWHSPNPIGVDGLPVPGEAAATSAIAYGIPDVSGAAREAYAGKRILVIGGGHSAINVVLDVLRLQRDAPTTRMIWALRRDRIDRLLGGGLNDALPERGALGIAARAAIDSGRLELLAPFAVERLEQCSDAIRVSATVRGEPVSIDVDRIIVATGFRPDTGLFSELRVALDPAVEAPLRLAPLIDPNLHSCGTVPPHGAADLAHPEPGFTIAGSKSYGRAPTFLMMTGYEQVRSIVAEIAGDHEAAREVRLVLPETGVCTTDTLDAEAQGCCGGAAAASQQPEPQSAGCCGGAA